MTEEKKEEILKTQEQIMEEIENFTEEASLEDLREGGLTEDGRGDE